MENGLENKLLKTYINSSPYYGWPVDGKQGSNNALLFSHILFSIQRTICHKLCTYSKRNILEMTLHWKVIPICKVTVFSEVLLLSLIKKKKSVVMSIL